jgi:cytochrome c-type biogenesis protein
MPIEDEISAVSVLLLGLSLGMTACAVTCMPFIGTWAFGRAESQSGAWRDTLSFLGGRLVAYTTLGGISGGLGAFFVKQLSAGIGNIAIGLVAIFAATWLLWPSAKSPQCSSRKRLHGLPPMLMGAAMTLIPCAPLTTLLAAAAAGGSIERGAFLGLLFGTGALMTPMLVLIPVAAGLGRHIRLERHWIIVWVRSGAAAVLFYLGKVRLDSLAEGLFPYVVGLAIASLSWAHYRHKYIKPQQTPQIGRRTFPLHERPAAASTST